MKFRRDINGLRAWAVLAVILYHFSLPGFDGGFVGVDIFFVISGYLMTSIILEKYKIFSAGIKSIWIIEFFFDRAKRILPALFVLIAFLLCLGWLALSPPDYRELARQSLTALSFTSNFLFWREAGYFDIASHEKWLLHTWSLSVEWQFYILYPFLLVCASKIFRNTRSLIVFLAVSAVSSLALSIYLSHSQPEAAFYLLPSRAWEMLTGGLVYFLTSNWSPNRILKITLEYLGLSLILISIFKLDMQVVWPGYLAILPVLGTVLVLSAANQNSKWTGSPPIQNIGLWSYSIYLWHWPLVVATTFFVIDTKFYHIACGVILSILLGWISYTLIEQPSIKWLKRKTQSKHWNAFVSYGLAVAVLAVPGFIIWAYQGLPGRLSPKIELAAGEAINFNPRRNECHVTKGTDFKACIYGGNNIKAILVGDSHAISLVSAIQASLPSLRDGVLAFTYTSCPTIFDVKLLRHDLRCSEFNEWVMNEIESIPSNVPIIIINRTSVYALGDHIPSNDNHKIPLVYFDSPPKYITNDFLKEFRYRSIESACRFANKRPVFLVRPIPEMSVNVPKYVARRMQMGEDFNVSQSFEEYMDRHSFVWSVQDETTLKCSVKIIDPTSALCINGKCMGELNGRPIYYDDHHLSEFAANEIVGISKVFSNALKSSTHLVN